MKIKSIFCLLLLILFSSCSKNSEATTPVDDMSVSKTLLNISYGTSFQQVFDLYLPANRTSATKTIIFVHGGGWTSGDKADVLGLLQLLKSNLPNYAFANINYRLATTGNPALPMQINDIQSVINNLKSNNYGISDKFSFIGVSAGAHLSMLYSYAYNTNNEVKAVCSIVGPANFTDPNYLNNTTLSGLYLAIAGQTYNDNPAFFVNASPYHKATADSPPTLLLYGNADSLIPITQGQDMNSRLNQLGVYNQFRLYNGGHGDWSVTDWNDAYSRIISFINLKF